MEMNLKKVRSIKDYVGKLQVNLNLQLVASKKTKSVQNKGSRKL